MKTVMTSSRRLFALFGLFVVIAAFVLMHQPAAPPVEVSLHSLVLTNGRLHLKESHLVFNGIMVERYPDGSLQSRSAVLNGKLHGSSEGFYTNGQLHVVEHFKEGVSHGLRTKWHMNAAKMSEANLKEGKIEGTFKRWHENGFLSEVIEMRDGAPNGSSIAYHPDGSLKAKARLENGKVIDLTSWQLGELKPHSNKNGT